MQKRIRLRNRDRDVEEAGGNASMQDVGSAAKGRKTSIRVNPAQSSQRLWLQRR